MNRTIANHGIEFLTTSPRRIRDKNPQIVGQILQNQDAAAFIYIRSGGDGHAKSYLRISPGGDYPQDALVPGSELWAYSNVAGTILTIVDKFEQAGL